MLISVDKLASILDDPDVILADARSFQEYSKGHIPGAVHMDLLAFHWIDTTIHGIKGFNSQASALMSFLGVAPGKKVVFYDSISGMLASRGVWMLTYLSHSDVMMLDGGITKWVKDSLPLETTSRGFTRSEFSGNPDTGIISGFEHILENLDSAKIIDVRSPEEYDGSMVRAARSGHIPNAININWSLNLKSDGTFKNIEELSKLYDIPLDAKIITYCQGAYRAANTFLALKKLGYTDVSVYLGSWGEWGNMNLPVEI